MPAVAVVRTGTANLASVLAALRRCGAQAVATAEARQVERAEHVVLPGVGSFGAMMAALGANDLVEPLRDRLLRGGSTLAICLGLQVLAASSEESPDVRGLNVVPGSLKRFPSAEVRVPQLGWNWVSPAEAPSMIQPGHAYFANSYRLEQAPPEWMPTYCDYGGRFVAGIQRGAVLACQFHPELSGAWGAALIRRWLGGDGGVSC